MNKKFIKSSTSIAEIKSKIETWLSEVDMSEEFHFKKFNISKLKIRNHPKNYIIDQHLIEDPIIASEKCNWNEEHWIKVIDLLHRENFENCFWDTEVPVGSFGNVDLILGKNVINSFFSEIYIFEAKTEYQPRKGLRHALYYAHFLFHILKKEIPDLRMNLILLVVPSTRSLKSNKGLISNEMLTLLKSDSNEILNQYKGVVSEIKIFDINMPISLPNLIPHENVIIPDKLEFNYYPIDQINKEIVGDFGKYLV